MDPSRKTITIQTQTHVVREQMLHNPKTGLASCVPATGQASMTAHCPSKNLHRPGWHEIKTKKSQRA